MTKSVRTKVTAERRGDKVNLFENKTTIKDKGVSSTDTRYLNPR